ncbi:hypothetical protein [uncultured Alistipes sp.]|uniref:hypothetical protein n=1 Tax=uncultured Alistipes sp. TaxID=538949 RepID=UPI0026036CD7|nr:hypothetical protein [uncultured Alistipes sp.]
MKMLLRKEKGGTNAVRRPFAAAVGGAVGSEGGLTFRIGHDFVIASAHRSESLNRMCRSEWFVVEKRRSRE